MHGLLMMPGCAFIGAILGLLLGLPLGRQAVKIGMIAGLIVGCAAALIMGGLNPALAIGFMAAPMIIGIWNCRKVA